MHVYCMIYHSFNFSQQSSIKKKNHFFFLNGESQSTNVTEKNQYREEQKITQEKGAEKERLDETSWRP